MASFDLTNDTIASEEIKKPQGLPLAAAPRLSQPISNTADHWQQTRFNVSGR
jgi:hypothetical protein